MQETDAKTYLEIDPTHLPEVWSWYGIGVFFILARFAVRLRTVGVSGFHGDDYLNIPFLILYTINLWVVQVTYRTGGNINVTPEMVPSLSDQEVATLEYGSKLEFMSWYTYPGSIWVLKFIVLFFYRRLTFGGTLRRRTLRTLFGLCGLSWMVLYLSITFTCRPFRNNWIVKPLPGPECTFRPQNFWILVCLNVITDAALLAIPLPILWHLRVSFRRKIGVGILLSSGVFIISSAVVRAITTLTGSPSIININRWGFRETAVGIMSVTLPILSPMATPEFWMKGPYRRNQYRAGSHHPNQARFGNWLGTMVLQYIDEQEGEPFKEPTLTKYLHDAGYPTELTERWNSSKGSSTSTGGAASINTMV
ncbi:hypothetical protein B0I35DRAFT_426045 [Stachybotrys elegans]|uniref:Rhodopsin domain-containing protein n=1 Tax=Stachybotrys elegans TaxID=80388 RepID=A0A8K0STD5_9HYPO|nr:hypothetical protein B0I35DRAFT_426045 [Stachybotrys elegans]